MFPRNRLSYMVLAAAMTVTLLFSSTAMADDGQGALDFVPEETMMVLAIDVEQMRTTDLFKAAMKEIEKEPEAKESLELLKSATGFDLQKDLASLVIAIPPDIEKTENFLVIAKGNFDEKKIVAYAEEQAKTNGGTKFTAQTHADMTWYEVDDGGIGFAGDYAFVGPKAAVKAAIDTHKGKIASVKKGEKGKALNAVIDAVDKKGDLWFAVTIPAEMQKQLQQENPMAGDFETARGSIDLGSGLKLRINLVSKSEDTVKTLQDLAQAGLQQAQGDAMIKQLGLDVAMSKLKVTAQKKELAVQLDLDSKEFENVVAALKGVAGGM